MQDFVHALLFLRVQGNQVQSPQHDMQLNVPFHGERHRVSLNIIATWPLVFRQACSYSSYCLILVDVLALDHHYSLPQLKVIDYVKHTSSRTKISTRHSCSRTSRRQIPILLVRDYITHIQSTSKEVVLGESYSLTLEQRAFKLFSCRRTPPTPPVDRHSLSRQKLALRP